MAKLKEIFDFFNSEHVSNQNNALVPDFQDLLKMRRLVPYLRNMRFRQTALTAGDSRSSFKGRGMEFAEVRLYNAGDDVRDIDWRVTARKNQPFTKLYTEEKDREVYAWLDLSASMRFGTQKELKSVTASKIAALLGWFTLENKDRFGLALFDGHQTRFYDSERTQTHLLEILKQIENVSKQTLYDATDTESAQKSVILLQKKISRRAIVFFISSFADFENMKKTLRSLAHQNDVYLIDVYDPIEAVPPPEGTYLAQYQQSQALFVNDGARFEAHYQNYFAKKRQFIKDFCLQNNCHYRQVESDQDIARQIRPI